MPAYQIHRMKETQRQQFRWAPHTPGVTVVKLKDYEPGQVIEAASPYALWRSLRERGEAIAVGDLIEVVEEVAGLAPGVEVTGQISSGELVRQVRPGEIAGHAPVGEVACGQTSRGELRILKYIGFEEAHWYVPESAPKTSEEPVAVR